MHRTSLMGVLGCALAFQLAGCSRQSAEDKAKDISDVLQDKGTAAAESVTTGVGKVLKGVERGFEKSGRTVALSEGARQAFQQGADEGRYIRVALDFVPEASAR